MSDCCLERACINSPIPDVAPDPAVTGQEAEHVNIPDLDHARHPQDSYYGIMAFTMRCHILPDQQCLPWLRQLTEQFRGKTLIEGRYCPYRRADRPGIAPDAAGIITCPLYGRRWRAQTGKVIDPPPMRTEAERYRAMFGDDHNSGEPF